MAAAPVWAGHKASQLQLRLDVLEAEKSFQAALLEYIRTHWADMDTKRSWARWRTCPAGLVVLWDSGRACEDTCWAVCWVACWAALTGKACSMGSKDMKAENRKVKHTTGTWSKAGS